MKSDFLIALTQLAAERNLPRNTVISAIELALAAAYKKDNFENDFKFVRDVGVTFQLIFNT